MSTKIYDAWAFDGTVPELLEWLFRFRKRYVAHVLGNMKKLFKPEADPAEVAKLIRDVTKQNWNVELNASACAVIYVLNKAVYVQFFGLGWDWPKGKRYGKKFHVCREKKR